MRGKFYVNGSDSYTTWGVLLLKDSLKEVLKFPKRKNIISNDWAEIDCEETYVKDSRAKVRELTLNFGAIGQNANLDGFIDYIVRSGTCLYNFNDLFYSVGSYWLSANLRVVTFSKYEYNEGKMSLVSIKFVEDIPNTFENLKSSYTQSYGSNLMSFGGINESFWNMLVTEGTADSFLCPKDVKQNLVIGAENENPQYYFPSIVGATRKGKTFTINAVFRGASLDDLLSAYCKFYEEVVNLNTLVDIQMNGSDFVLKCYFSDQSITDFDIDNFAIFTSLSFVLADEFSLNSDNLLVMEDGDTYIVTESDTDEYIELELEI